MGERKYKKYNFNSEYRAHGYPESTWPLLNEYFSRDAAEFDLSDKEVKGKLATLLDNLDTIEIDDQPGSTNNALYHPGEKKITLNFAGISERFPDGSMQTQPGVAHLCALFHELGHVDENLNSDTPNSFMHFDKNGRLKGVCFNEIHKEMRAARLTMNMRLPADAGPGSDPKCMVRHVGYNDLMFIGTMVHTALGVSEKEFLAAAEKGPEYFRETMSKKFDDPQDFDAFMKSVIFASDSIHTFKYKHETMSKTDERNLANMTTALYNECLRAMDARISTELKRGEIDPEVFSEKTRYELERLAANYQHGMTTNTPYTMDSLNGSPIVEATKEKILAIETALSSKKKLSKKEYASLIEELNSGEVDVDETLSKYGLTLPSIADISTIDTSEYKRDFLEEDYGSDYWNNVSAIDAIRRMDSDSQMRSQTIIDPKSAPSTNSMDRLKEVNSPEEVRTYDSSLVAASDSAIEVDVKVTAEDVER